MRVRVFGYRNPKPELPTKIAGFEIHCPNWNRVLRVRVFRVRVWVFRVRVMGSGFYAQSERIVYYTWLRLLYYYPNIYVPT